MASHGADRTSGSHHKDWYTELESSGRLNRLMYRVTGILGLTTGVGIIAWGVWSLLAAIGTLFYEQEAAMTVEEILVNNAFSEGLLLSPVIIALGVVILELRKIQETMQAAIDRKPGGDRT